MMEGPRHQHLHQELQEPLEEHDATKRPTRLPYLFITHISGSMPPVDGASSTCALGGVGGSARFVNQTTISLKYQTAKHNGNFASFLNLYST